MGVIVHLFCVMWVTLNSVVDFLGAWKGSKVPNRIHAKWDMIHRSTLPLVSALEGTALKIFRGYGIFS